MHYPLLNSVQQHQLYDALYYMTVPELREQCRSLSIPEKGIKGELIHRIMAYIKSGTIPKTLSQAFPEKSKAKNYPPQPLHQNALML